ncbi:FUSC family protein [Streptomyces sp. NPDC021020]|uniref:FUSC family protein n=1 Tax=Streptomyces sp. NPDC021020 TaxID=3365109 RepID=UPI0037BE0F66
MLDRLRLLDPGRVRLHAAARTILAALAALLISAAICAAEDLPGALVVIATVVAVMLSRSLHRTSLAHRLTALVHVPVVGLLAAAIGRFMLHHAWLGAAMYVAAVTAARYLMRFGGTVRALGRLALGPVIAILVVPIPPSAAEAAAPWWAAAAGALAVACVLLSQAALPARPAREAATAALDVLRAARRLQDLPPSAAARARAARALHRAALTTEDRLAAATPASPSFAALATAVLHAEVLATTSRPAQPPGAAGPADLHPRPASGHPLTRLLPGGRSAARTRPPGTATEGPAETAAAGVVAAAAAVRATRARELPAPPPPRAPRPGSARKSPQPQTRLTAQLAAAMALAFAAGHLVFPHHWTWTVITAFVVCSAARARGDVVHRSALRIGGAIAGAVTGTLAAHLVAATPPAALAVIFCCLFVGVWLRDVNYAVWAFCVTSLLAVLYSLNGEHDTAALLLQRPEGILLGSACGVLAAYFVLPLRTETVMRGRAARALQALQDLLAAAREPDPQPAALRTLARTADRAARDLGDAAASARAHRALRTRLAHPALPVRPAHRPAPHAADWADALAACVHEARALAALPPEALAAARPHLGLTARNLGHVRRRLGHRPEAEPPRPVTAPPVHHLNAALAALYAQLPATPRPSERTDPLPPVPSGAGPA